jgi:hypothetical protein
VYENKRERMVDPTRRQMFIFKSLFLDHMYLLIGQDFNNVSGRIFCSCG